MSILRSILLLGWMASCQYIRVELSRDCCLKVFVQADWRSIWGRRFLPRVCHLQAGLPVRAPDQPGRVGCRATLNSHTLTEWRRERGPSVLERLLRVVARVGASGTDLARLPGDRPGDARKLSPIVVGPGRGVNFGLQVHRQETRADRRSGDLVNERSVDVVGIDAEMYGKTWV